MNIGEAHSLAYATLKEHGLTEQGWTFGFDNAKRRFGCCHYSSKTITLSEALVELNGKMRVYNTILHEVAHALAGHGAGHGREWQQIAKSIGCDGNRLYDSATVAKPPKAFKGECPNCGRVVERHRRSQIACGTCCRIHNDNKYDAQYLFVWRRA